MNIKKVVLVLFRSCVSRDYRCIRLSKAFDFSYYLRLQGDVNEGALDPLWDYIKKSKLQEKLTGNVVDEWRQQADPHPLFDTSYYLLQYFPQGLKGNPFVHYLRYGWRKGYKPGPYFDSEVYQKRSGWKVSNGNPLSHYNLNAQDLKESTCLNLDAEYYFDKNPSFIESKQEIIKEYKFRGAPIGKSPLPIFDPDFYLGQIAPDTTAKTDPFAHFFSTANSSGYLPGKLFDPDFYLQECGVQLSRSETLTHYVTQGVFMGAYCHPRVAALTSTPLISIVVPVYNPDPGALRNCIRSVLYQAYPHWELCLADDCSTHADVRPLMEEWARKDSRIKLTFLSQNGGIARATNEAEKIASGTHLGFLDNDDELTVDCLLEVVETINNQKADLVYSDEDLIGNDGSTLSVFRKPDFNLGLLLSHNYITHFVAVKRSLFKEVGGLDSTYDGAQDYDLMLKLSEVCETIVHIPKVLYHWRASESSTSINHEQKNYANEAGRLALQAAVSRRGLVHEVTGTELNFFYRLSLPESFTASVTVLIWAVETDGCRPDFLTHLNDRSDSADVEYIVAVDEKSRKVVTSCIEVTGLKGCQVVSVGKSESRAEVLDRLIRASDRDFIVLLNGHVESLSQTWLKELYSALIRPHVALVCGRTTYGGGDGESYLLPDITNISSDYLRKFLTSSTRHMAGLHCPQDVSYVSWDIALLRKEDFEVAGGFNFTKFPDMFAMTDLSIRLRAHGKIIAYTPFAIVDKEAVSAGTLEDESERKKMEEEKRLFQTLLQEQDAAIDPFYNQGLLMDNGIDEDSYREWLRGATSP